MDDYAPTTSRHPMWQPRLPDICRTLTAPWLPKSLILGMVVTAIATAAMATSTAFAQPVRATGSAFDLPAPILQSGSIPGQQGPSAMPGRWDPNGGNPAWSAVAPIAYSQDVPVPNDIPYTGVVQQAGANAYGMTDAGMGIASSQNSSYKLAENKEWTFTPYTSLLTYGADSVKNQGRVSGMYSKLDLTYDKFEFDFAFSDIAFRDGSKLNQWDYTFVYTNYWIDNFGWKAGVHHIQSADPTTDNGNIPFGGFQFYELDQWDAGMDVFVSLYDNLLPHTRLIQLTPYAGWFLYKTDDAFLRAQVTGYYIRPETNIGSTRENYFSGEFTLTNRNGPWTTGVYAWGGLQVFPVRRGGFLIFNLAEQRFAGYGGETSYRFNDWLSITGRLGNEHFKDIVNGHLTYQLAATALLSIEF